VIHKFLEIHCGIKKAACHPLLLWITRHGNVIYRIRIISDDSSMFSIDNPFNMKKEKRQEGVG
jgi:hypothetical protein